jgi:diguanylate cyclase (GGDEF)-like protein
MRLIGRVSWLTALAVALATAGGTAFGLWAARDALQAQWSAANRDAAVRLAAVLAGQGGDALQMKRVATEALDAGRYRLVRLRAPDDTLLLERESPPASSAVPAWLVESASMSAPPGIAVVGDGLQAVARVEVEGDAEPALGALWSGLWRGFAWLFGAALASLAAAAWLLRRWFGALDRLVVQAQALSEGRFVEVAEPAAGEFRRLASGMNAAVRRLRMLFDSHATQLEAVRMQAQVDALTGLSNRRHFLARLERALVGKAERGAAPDTPRRGSLLIVRLHDLEAMNKRVGHATVDRLLASMSEVLLAYPRRVDGAFAGRLNGGDLALYLPVNGLARETAEALRATLSVSLGAVDGAAAVAIGGVDRLPTGNVSEAMARADEALARAESAGGFALDVRDAGDAAALGEGAWRQRIGNALAAGRIELAEFAVVGRGGQVIHLDCPLRIRLAPEGEFAPAAQWLPMAARGQQTQRVDLAAAGLALRAVARDGQARCVHVAPGSLADPGFAHEMARLLASTAAPARLLFIEVGEAQASQGSRWRDAAQLWAPFGVRLGLENAGGSIGHLADARGWGLHYLKLDGRFVRGLAHDGSLAQYARQIVATAHGVGVAVYAGGVDDPLDLARLWELGFDGATGPAAGAAR